MKYPRLTVACVVFNNGRYLLVEEQDKVTGHKVFNQPAGHVEINENITDATTRECLEETGYAIELASITGIYQFHSNHNDTSYCRVCFAGKLAQPEPVSTEIDPDILKVHWLTYDEILAIKAKLRSPLVLRAIKDFQANNAFPLDLITPLEKQLGDW